LLWAYASYKTGFFKSDFDIFTCDKSAQAGVWVQMFIAAEILVFSARCPTFFFMSLAPSPSLVISIFIGCLIVSILACAVPYFGHLWVQDVAIIWLYDLICFFVVDACKVVMLDLMGENFEVLNVDEVEDLPEPPKIEKIESKSIDDVESQAKQGYMHASLDEDSDSTSTKSYSSLRKLENWKSSKHSIGASVNEISIDLNADRSMSSGNIVVPRSASSAAVIAAKRTRSAVNTTDRNAPAPVPIPIPTTITVARSEASFGSAIDLRRGKISASNLRPYTPANKALR
jgi:hypothetical protein